MKDAIILHVISVNINFVGFVSVNGQYMMVLIINAIK